MTDKPTITQADRDVYWKLEIGRERKWTQPEREQIIAAHRESAVAELQAEVERLRAALEIIARGAARSHDTFKEKLGGRSYPTWFAVNELQMGLDSITGTARAALAQKEPVE